MKDGFKILCDLIFQLSPQLDGSFFHFGADSKFYLHAQELAQEITLANLFDGNTTDLNYQFLSYLHYTRDSTILGITNPYWTSIMIF
jgi:hypothetical protein